MRCAARLAQPQDVGQDPGKGKSNTEEVFHQVSADAKHGTGSKVTERRTPGRGAHQANRKSAVNLL